MSSSSNFPSLFLQIYFPFDIQLSLEMTLSKHLVKLFVDFFFQISIIYKKCLIDYFETVQSVIYFIWFLSLITALLVFPGDLIALWLHSQRSCWLGLLVAFYMFCYSFFFLKLNLNVLHNCICRASGKSSIKHIPSESVSVRILRLVGCPLPTWRVWIPALKPCEYGLWLEFAKGYLFHTNLSLPRTRVKSDVIFYCLFLLSLKSFICRRRHPLFPSAFPACSAWNFFFSTKTKPQNIVLSSSSHNRVQ